MKRIQDTDWAALGGLRLVLAMIVFCTHLGGLYVLPRPLQAITQACAFPAAGWAAGAAAALGTTFIILHGVDLPYRAYARRMAAKRQATRQFRLVAAPAPYDTLKSVSKIAAPVPVSLPE